MSGFVYDSATQSLRQIVGVPGAAYLSDPLVADARAAGIAPAAKRALINAGGKLIAIPNLDAPSAVPSADLDASLIVWNRSGSAAAAYDGSVHLFRNGAWERLESPEGRVVALAVNDEGNVVAAAVEGSGVATLEAGRSPRLVASSPNPTSLLSLDAHLYFTDADRGELLRIENWTDGATVFASGLTGAAGAAASRDGKSILVASRSAKSVTAFRVATGETLGQVALDFEPTSLMPVNDGLWLLNAGQSTAQLLNSDLQVFFVPAAR